MLADFVFTYSIVIRILTNHIDRIKMAAGQTRSETLSMCLVTWVLRIDL